MEDFLETELLETGEKISISDFKIAIIAILEINDTVTFELGKKTFPNLTAKKRKITIFNISKNKNWVLKAIDNMDFEINIFL